MINFIHFSIDLKYCVMIFVFEHTFILTVEKNICRFAKRGMTEKISLFVVHLLSNGLLEETQILDGFIMPLMNLLVTLSRF